MTKILIISQTGFIPNVSAQILRLFKLSKYFSKNGFEVTVFTTNIDRKMRMDFSTEKELSKLGINIIRKKIRIPYRKWSNSLSKILYLPSRSFFWSLFFSNQMARSIDREYEFILSSTPPDAHLFARNIKSATSIKWICDYADLWSINPNPRKNPPFYRFIEKRAEYNFIKDADLYTFVSAKQMKIFKNEFPYLEDKDYLWIPNGFDKEDFLDIKPLPFAKTTFVYLGTVYERFDITPFVLFNRLFKNNKIKKNIQIIFVGSISENKRRSIIGHIPAENVKFLGALDHKDAIRYLVSGDALVFYHGTARKEVAVTSRLPEYLYANKFILDLGGKNTYQAQLISEYGYGKSFDLGDYKEFEKTVMDIIENPQRYKKLKRKENLKVFDWEYNVKKIIRNLKA